MSAHDELKQLEKRREELRAQLRSDAEAGLRQSLVDFNNLNFGVTYELREARRGRGQGSRRGTRQVNAERACPICGFRTIPPHDARAHRSQGDKKKAFSAEELSAKGLQKA
jgi:hypothetical protein